MAKIEYDNKKMLRTMRERGLHFDFAVVVLCDPDVRIVPDNREDYGEERWRAYGKCFGGVVCVCFTMREGCFRVFSMFRVHEKKKEKYYGKN